MVYPNWRKFCLGHFKSLLPHFIRSAACHDANEFIRDFAGEVVEDRLEALVADCGDCLLHALDDRGLDPRGGVGDLFVANKLFEITSDG